MQRAGLQATGITPLLANGQSRLEQTPNSTLAQYTSAGQGQQTDGTQSLKGTQKPCCCCRCHAMHNTTCCACSLQATARSSSIKLHSVPSTLETTNHTRVEMLSFHLSVLMQHISPKRKNEAACRLLSLLQILLVDYECAQLWRPPHS
jgi:hypothetical protein